MHETSLVEFTLNAVEKKALSMNITRVKSIQLVIGSMRGALPVLMQRAFSSLTYRRPLFYGAVLEIEELETRVRCRECGNEFAPGELHGVKCPECGASSYEIIQGEELYISSFEPADQV